MRHEIAEYFVAGAAFMRASLKGAVVTYGLRFASGACLVRMH